MVLDPNAPSWAPSEWDAYIADPYAVPLQVATPEYGLGPIAIPPPPPPPPPPPTQKLGPDVGGGPTVAEEIAQNPSGQSTAPALSPMLGVAENSSSQSLTPPLLAEPATPIRPPLLGTEPARSLEADAVSGVDAKPPAEAFTSTAPIPTERPDEELSDEDLGVRYADLTPEQQVMIRAKVEGAKENFKATRILEESERNRQRAEQNLKDRADAMKVAHERTAKIDAEARALAARDPAENIPTWKKIIGVIAAVIGGFDRSGNGNVGLQALHGLVEQAAAQQKQQLEVLNKERASIGQEVQDADALYEAQEKTRLVAWDHIIGTTEAQVQQFDPRGTRAVRVMDALTQMRAKRAEALAKYNTEQQKRIEELLKQQREVAKLQEEQRHNKAQEKTAATSAYASLITAKTGARKATQDYDIDQKKLKLEADKLRAEADKLRAAGDEKAATRLLEQGVAAPPEASVDDKGNVVIKTDTGALKQADDKPWIIPTVDEAKEFRKKKAAADDLVTNLDELIQIRDRVGGESSVWNSDDLQRIRVIKENLVLRKKAGTQGMSSDADMDRIIGSLGAKDPASFWAQMAGLEEGRKQVELQLNTDARSLGYNGKPISYANPRKLKGGTTVEQAAAQNVMTFDPRAGDYLGKAAVELGVVDNPEYATATQPRKQQMMVEALANAGGLPPSIKKSIDDLQATVDNPKATPKARDAARALLNQISTEAESDAVRSYATPYANRNAVPVPEPSEEQLSPEVR